MAFSFLTLFVVCCTHVAASFNATTALNTTNMTTFDSGNCCFGSCGTSCQGGWCGESKENCEGNCKGMWCGGSSGPTPSPSPGPTPPTPPGPADAYCPTEESFGHDGGVVFNGNGWTITGSGGVHSTVTWNLNGGYVEFDMDTSRATAGTNNNLYTTSPDHVSGTNECDIQGEGKPSCMEMDIVEMNGNCLAASTVHTWSNHNGGCDKGGCAATTRVSGKFHVKASFSADGWMTVAFNGNNNDGYNPHPSENCKQNVVQNMNSKGAQIQSSQWQGWVPGANQCPGGGNLGSSSFTISNLVVKGTVVQGSEPKRCNAMMTNSSMVVV